MKKIFLLIIISLVWISCSKISPKGEIVTEEVKVENFNKINLQGNFMVFYVKNSKNFISIESYKNIIDNLDISVDNQTLTIKEKREPEKVDFYNITIYANNFDVCELSQSTELNVSSQLEIDKFSLNLKDKAKFIGSVLSKKTEVKMSGNSRANFLGKTDTLLLKISDSAAIISPYYYVNFLNIESKKNNYTELSVQEDLQGTIQDKAKLIYYGNPVKKISVKDKATIENKKL